MSNMLRADKDARRSGYSDSRKYEYDPAVYKIRTLTMRKIVCHRGAPRFLSFAIEAVWTLPSGPFLFDPHDYLMDLRISQWQLEIDSMLTIPEGAVSAANKIVKRRGTCFLLDDKCMYMIELDHDEMRR